MAVRLEPMSPDSQSRALSTFQDSLREWGPKLHGALCHAMGSVTERPQARSPEAGRPAVKAAAPLTSRVYSIEQETWTSSD